MPTLHYRLFALNAQIFFLLLGALACLSVFCSAFECLKPGQQAQWPGSKPQIAARPLSALLLAYPRGGRLADLRTGAWETSVPGIGQKTYVEPNESPWRRSISSEISSLHAGLRA